MSFVSMFVHKKHSSYLLRKLNSSLKFTMLAACGFYWHYSKAVTVILADSRLVEVPRRIMIKRKWWNRTNKFFTLVMVFKTECILVTVEMKMYIYVHMPSVSFSLLFRCWGQSQCAVCYGFSWQCYNGKKKNYKNV